MLALTILRICISVLGAIIGAVLIAMGFNYYHIQNDLAELFKVTGISQPTIAILFMGVMIFVMSVISFLSAFRNTLLCKLIYSIILGSIISFLIVIAIMVFVRHSDYLDQSGQMFDRIWQNRQKPSAERYLDKVNQFFRCCGSESHLDYGGITPATCCDAPVDNICSDASIYKNGCRKAVIGYSASKAELVGSIAIVTAVVLSIVVISSFI